MCELFSYLSDNVDKLGYAIMYKSTNLSIPKS